MPKIYGIEHIIFLIIAFAVLAGLVIFTKFKIKTEKQILILLRILGVLLLGAITWNRISIAIFKEGYLYLAPNSFCGTTSLVLAILAIFPKKDNKALHSVVYLGLLGSIITLAYPDFIGQDQSIFFPRTISGLVHHTITMYIAVLMLQTKFLKPDLKKFHLLPIGLSIYLTYGLFLITVAGYNNAMYIYKPILSGTNLNWFVLGMIFLPAHLLFLLSYNFIEKKMLKNKN